jgi:hypothetical protein
MVSLTAPVASPAGPGATLEAAGALGDVLSDVVVEVVGEGEVDPAVAELPELLYAVLCVAGLSQAASASAAMASAAAEVTILM